MPRFRNVDGVKIQFTAQEEIDRDAEELEATRPRTAAELEAVVQKDIDQKIGANASDIDKTQFFIDADIWQALNPGMTQVDARTAVRGRYEFHLRAIRGL